MTFLRQLARIKSSYYEHNSRVCMQLPNLNSKLYFSLAIFLLCMAVFNFLSAIFMPFECYYFMDYNNYYTCNVQYRIMTIEDRVTVEKAIGEHLEGKTDDDVEKLTLSNAFKLQLFPHNVNNIFKNLKYINMVYENLTLITTEDLKVFPKLQTLDLSGNQIEFISKDTFIFNPNIEEIWLYDNKISHIDPTSFDKLKNLKVLVLDKNVCTFERALNRTEVLKIIGKIVQGFCISDRFTTDWNRLT
ncbi:hypothetical protein PVAND_006354 [Polypedilum vanderplanki]|uniref:Uncharacterized protein n=1 Tax=Polypedilum vanderplanki TaxID=319348 RepID=A0A9J6C4N5_POLVA|nr:hypothetical protein PVAND_006354 [Polypedilum vanderplanki]